MGRRIGEEDERYAYLNGSSHRYVLGSIAVRMPLQVVW
jgi:hypothetical protein